MPRVTIVARTREGQKELREWRKRTGKAPSFWDVCRLCADLLLELDLPTDLKPYNGEPEISYITDGKAEHPDYDGRVKYTCACCKQVLVEADN